jgi:hypothetical protein
VNAAALIPAQSWKINSHIEISQNSLPLSSPSCLEKHPIKNRK